jgi:hypothetical protein
MHRQVGDVLRVRCRTRNSSDPVASLGAVELPTTRQVFRGRCLHLVCLIECRHEWLLITSDLLVERAQRA